MSIYSIIFIFSCLSLCFVIELKECILSIEGEAERFDWEHIDPQIKHKSCDVLVSSSRKLSDLGKVFPAGQRIRPKISWTVNCPELSFNSLFMCILYLNTFATHKWHKSDERGVKRSTADFTQCPQCLHVFVETRGWTAGSSSCVSEVDWCGARMQQQQHSQ